MHIEVTNIILAILTIIISNAILVLGLVWKASRWVSRIETQLVHVNEKLNSHADSTKVRLDNLEVRVLNLERAS